MKRLTTLDILKLLKQSNCGECQLTSCMAFAAAVYQGLGNPQDCPHLNPESLYLLTSRLAEQVPLDWTGQDLLQTLQKRLPQMDLTSRASLLGGHMQGDHLIVRCLGKLFAIDPKGGLHSECHQNPWLHVPLLSYLLDSQGFDPQGDWVRFEELSTTKPWVRFFEHAAIVPLQKLAESNLELLLDILSLFASKKGIKEFPSPHTFVLYPLPKVPFLFVCHAAEHNFPAQIAIYLDRQNQHNLDPESLFRLGRGLAEMFLKIAKRHGYTPAI